MDHDHLRALLRRVEAYALQILRDEKRRSRVRAALAELRDAFEAHLADEEKSLTPLLARADAWGPARVEQLMKEHAGQRALLAALMEDAGDGVRDAEALVDEIRWFVQSLEREMRDEEATFLNAEAVGEEAFVTDRLAG